MSKSPLQPANGTRAATDTVQLVQQLDASGNVVGTSQLADTELPAAAALSDSASNPTTPTVGAVQLVYDGTQIVRVRQQPGTAATYTPTGVVATGLSLQTSTNVYFPVLAMSQVGDTGAGQGTVPVGPVHFNGTTYDRSRTVTGASTGTAAVGLQPGTTGGLSVSRAISAASTNATSAKASAGQVYGWIVTNVNAAVRYFKLYNKASAPTVGTDTPALTIAIPAGGVAEAQMANGVAFGTGVAWALTTGIADADTGAVAASEHSVNLLYK